MARINILGLGPGDIDYLTLGVINKLKSGNKNFLRTEKHPTVEYLIENNIGFESYDYVYNRENSFKDVYEYIVNDLIEKAYTYGDINYLVPGNPMVAENTVKLLISKKDDNLEVGLLEGISFIGPIARLVGRDPIDGLKVLDGMTFDMNDIDINIDYIIAQVYNKRIASDIKLILSEVYGDEYEIYVLNSAGVREKELVYRISILELDRVDCIDALTSIYIPKVDKITKKIYDLNDVMATMRLLRSREGCPWDKKQTHKSLRQTVVEEAYEVADAIDKDSAEELIEELGDLLLQIVFHCQIASEEGSFNLYNITTGLNKKLIFRHPHIFCEKKVEKSEEVVYNWNKLKYKERGISSYTEILKNVPRLPSLMRAYKVQERARQFGFDWHTVDGALDKVNEEYYEVIESINSIKGGDIENTESELGDLLFAVVNVCRFLNVNPEIALNRTINKFINRFEIMDVLSKEMGRDLQEMTLEEMNTLWEKAKLHKH